MIIDCICATSVVWLLGITGVLCFQAESADKNPMLFNDIIWEEDNDSGLGKFVPQTGYLSPDSYWPSDIPYALHGFSDDERKLVESNLQTIERLTSDCLRFRERKSEQEFIQFERKSGFPAICQAGIGRHAGRPTLVKLHQQCLTSGIIQHELLHALGFLHEHSRPDRDEHISIVEDNMRPEVSKTNYQKMSKMATFGLPYDAESIMHYGLEVSKSPDKPAIVFKRSPPPRWMGQQYGLSPLDVAKIRAAYNCSKLTFKDVPSVANQDACATCAQNAGNEESEDFVVDERALAFVFPMPSMNTLPFTKEQCERQFSSVCNISLLHNEIGRSPFAAILAALTTP